MIDGVSAKEGRVLILTTNCPEKLDDVLLRSGRVDMKVEFTLCSREQIVDMFSRMYSSSDHGESKTSHSMNNSAPTGHSFSDNNFRALLTKALAAVYVEPENLAAMAEKFADLVLTYKFSPAELQGFLLTRKKQPDGALAEKQKKEDQKQKRKLELKLKKEAEKKRKSDSESDSDTTTDSKSKSIESKSSGVTTPESSEPDSRAGPVSSDEPKKLAEASEKIGQSESRLFSNHDSYQLSHQLPL